MQSDSRHHKTHHDLNTYSPTAGTKLIDLGWMDRRMGVCSRQSAPHDDDDDGNDELTSLSS